MIYLDNNATTPIAPEVAHCIAYLQQQPLGNPSSIHQYGQRAKGRLIQATQTVASYFGVRSEEVIFTSGATEALNLLIRSVPKGKHIITSSVEHIAVLEPLKHTGCSVTHLEPEKHHGCVTPQQIFSAIRDDTWMIVLGAVNNETGVITDIDEIARLAQQANIHFIVDGVALLGKAPCKLPEGVSAMCFSGHKIHGPLGVGCALVRSLFPLNPMIFGGPQQRGRRGGTENLLAIIAFTKALELIAENDWVQMERLRNEFEKQLCIIFPDVMIHGEQDKRVSNVTNCAFPGIDGETLLMHLDLAGVAVSHGSACSSGTLEPSRVLLNMGIPSSIARSSIRISLSRYTTQEEIDRAIACLAHCLGEFKKLQRSLR